MVYWNLSVIGEYDPARRAEYPMFEDCRRAVGRNMAEFRPVFELHEAVAQVYDGVYPYAYHLAQVVDTAREFMPAGMPDGRRRVLLLSAAMHDTIEDARMTYNDVRRFVAEKYGLSEADTAAVAETVYALTDEKGRSRTERHNERYWQTLLATPGAVFVKMCDRLANMRYSRATGSRMYGVYIGEMPGFLRSIAGSADSKEFSGIYDVLSAFAAEQRQ